MLKKTDLIEKYALEMGITKKDATVVVEKVIEIMKDSLIHNDGLDIFGFIKMEKVYKEAHEKKSPFTGEIVTVAAKYTPKAKFSSAFKKELNA